MMRPFVCLIPVFFFGLLVACATAEPPRQGVVRWIDDGDSFQLVSGERVRLLGIDTPESQTSRRDRYYKKYGLSSVQLRKTAKQALRFNMQHLKGKTIRLEYDNETRDKYNRLLAYVYLPDGRMINRLLLQQGYATVFRRFAFSKKQAFLALEQEAQQQRRGMWRFSR